MIARLAAVAFALFALACQHPETAAATTAQAALTNGTAPQGEAQAAPGSCQTDADCSKGQVCEGCRQDRPKECVMGCHRDDQCGPGERCHQVQCIRCPCPGQCQAP